MGSYDGAEICELVGLFILNKLGQKFGKENIGLYRDDGLAIVTVVYIYIKSYCYVLFELRHRPYFRSASGHCAGQSMCYRYKFIFKYTFTYSSLQLKIRGVIDVSFLQNYTSLIAYKNSRTEYRLVPFV